MVSEYLARRPRQMQCWVRINPLGSPLALPDLVAVVKGRPDGIVLPKLRSPRDLAVLDHYLTALEAHHGVPAGAIGIIPIATETPQGVS